MVFVMATLNNVIKNSPAGMRRLPEVLDANTLDYEQRHQDTLARMILSEELGHR